MPGEKLRENENRPTNQIMWMINKKDEMVSNDDKLLAVGKCSSLCCSVGFAELRC